MNQHLKAGIISALTTIGKLTEIKHMNANLSAIIKAGFFIFALYYATAYALVLPEYLYMFGIKIGLIG